MSLGLVVLFITGPADGKLATVDDLRSESVAVSTGTENHTGVSFTTRPRTISQSIVGALVSPFTSADLALEETELI